MPQPTCNKNNNKMLNKLVCTSKIMFVWFINFISFAIRSMSRRIFHFKFYFIIICSEFIWWGKTRLRFKIIFRNQQRIIFCHLGHTYVFILKCQHVPPLHANIYYILYMCVHIMATNRWANKKYLIIIGRVYTTATYCNSTRNTKHTKNKSILVYYVWSYYFGFVYFNS